MTNPYRAMCAELVDAILTPNPYNWEDSLHDSANRASALLAQPVAEGPTDEELLRLAREWNSGFESIELHFAADYARAVLAKWGRPTPQPEGGDIHYNWELHDAEGEWQAGGSAITLESVRREGGHYLQTYLQDGPHTLIIYQASTIEVVTNG